MGARGVRSPAAAGGGEEEVGLGGLGGLLPEPVSVWATFTPSAETPGREEGPQCSTAGLLVVAWGCGFDSRPRHSLDACSSPFLLACLVLGLFGRANGCRQQILTELLLRLSPGRSTQRCNGDETKCLETLRIV